MPKDDLHLREQLFEFVAPPPTLAGSKTVVLGAPAPAPPTNTADLMLMGFPTLVHPTHLGLCSCHSKLKNTGYSCPRCKSRICDVPTDCKVCGLTVVSSPQLSRSYRHLFPVSDRRSPSSSVLNRVARSQTTIKSGCTFLFLPSSTLTDTVYRPLALPTPPTCHACAFPFSTSTSTVQSAGSAANGLSPTGRYVCKTCERHFCLDCDVLVHTALGFCPGCI